MLANTGIRGIVQFYNNQPAVNLSIQIDSREPIFKTSSLGEYYRLLLPGNYTMKVMLNCNIVNSTAFSIRLDNNNSLLVLNITLSQTLYNSYIEAKNNLNQDALFCTLSRQPAKCTNDIITNTYPNALNNHTINNSNSIKIFKNFGKILMIVIFNIYYV